MPRNHEPDWLPCEPAAVKAAGQRPSWSFGKPGITITKAHLVAPHTDDRGIQSAAAEAAFAAQVDTMREYALWAHQNKVFLQGPWSMTLDIKLAEFAAPYAHSAGAWVLNPSEELFATLDDISATRPVTASAGYKALLDGSAGDADYLKESYELALAEGYVVPSGFASGREYRPHQKVAVATLAHQGGGLLGDQVGSGKGGSFVGGLLCLNDKLTGEGLTPSWPCVLSVPKSMVDEIAEEVLRWKGDAYIHIVKGTKRQELPEGPEFFILNHDILAARLPDLLERTPRAFIADEAHVFKNDKAKRTQAALELATAVRQNATRDGGRPNVVMASGTPFLNAPVELWSILGILGLADEFASVAKKELKLKKVRFVNRNGGWTTTDIWDKRAFELRWCGGAYDKFKAWHNSGSTNSAELHQLLMETGMVRRKKSDIMNPLPTLTENVALVNPGKAEMEHYREVRSEFRTWAMNAALEVAKETGMTKARAIAEVMRKLESGSEGIMRLTALRRALADSKVDPAVEWIHKFMDGSLEVSGPDGPTTVGEDRNRRKLILYVHHRDARERLVKHPELQKYGIATILSGTEQTGASVQDHKRRFMVDPKTRLIICSMAAREGHTLTSAWDVCLLEPPFVPSWVVQMAGRCWARMSEEFEPHDATIHYLAVPNTEDARSIRRLRNKKAVFNAVVDGETFEGAEVADEMSDPEALLDILALGEGAAGIAD